MFAAGRGISNIVGTKAKKGPTKVRKKRSKLTLRQRMYIPCMWSSCLSCCSGFSMMFGGMAMSFMGYYAEYFASSGETALIPSYNGTEEYLHINSALKFHISNFRYIGPLFMGLGTFLAIVACVIVLETRDKVLEMMEEKQWKKYKKKADFYDLIVLEMKRKEIAACKGKIYKNILEPVKPLETQVEKLPSFVRRLEFEPLFSLRVSLHADTRVSVWKFVWMFSKLFLEEWKTTATTICITLTMSRGGFFLQKNVHLHCKRKTNLYAENVKTANENKKTISNDFSSSWVFSATTCLQDHWCQVAHICFVFFVKEQFENRTLSLNNFRALQLLVSHVKPFWLCCTCRCTCKILWSVRHLDLNQRKNQPKEWKSCQGPDRQNGQPAKLKCNLI